MKQRLDRVIVCLDRFFGALACLALLGIIAVVLLQIFARYAMPQAPAWTEEASRYLFAYAIVLSSGSVIARKRHVRLELFQHRLSPCGATILSVTCHAGVAIFAIWLLPFAWEYLAVGARQTSPTLGIRMSWIFASAFVFFLLVALFSLLAAAQDVLTYRNREQS